MHGAPRRRVHTARRVAFGPPDTQHRSTGDEATRGLAHSFCAIPTCQNLVEDLERRDRITGRYEIRDRPDDVCPLALARRLGRTSSGMQEVLDPGFPTVAHVLFSVASGQAIDGSPLIFVPAEPHLGATHLAARPELGWLGAVTGVVRPVDPRAWKEAGVATSDRVILHVWNGRRALPAGSAERLPTRAARIPLRPGGDDSRTSASAKCNPDRAVSDGCYGAGERHRAAAGA